jgi:hypothetical protein
LPSGYCCLPEDAGESKVNDVDFMGAILVAHENVLGLEVPVHESSLVQLLQPKHALVADPLGVDQADS